MKKLFVIMALSVFAVACGSSESTETKTEEAAATVDSAATAVADSAKATIDSATTAVVDSAKAKLDSLKK
ncbi:hypothetical protein [Pollutibacter soli]|uniref:hypothetical protein n=1 Tax=Pollutibacter soli TaxID=3034157 RepID=UPI003013514E